MLYCQAKAAEPPKPIPGNGLDKVQIFATQWASHKATRVQKRCESSVLVERKHDGKAMEGKFLQLAFGNAFLEKGTENLRDFT